MNQKTKYYYLLKKFILGFILILIIGAIIKISTIYQYINPDLFTAIKIILRVINTLLIISVILIFLYFSYQIYNYQVSSFYKEYKIGVFEAMYHGIIDMYIVYQNIYFLADDNTIKIDYKNSIITFTRNKKNYSLIFMDLFGKIDGKEDSDFWIAQSKPRKKYGRKTYTKSIRFPNPIVVNQNYVEELISETDKEYIEYAVIAGFFKMKFKSDKIVSPYELKSLLN